MSPGQGKVPSNSDAVAHEMRAHAPSAVPKLTPDLLALFCQFLGGRVGVRGTPLLSTLVRRRPGDRWMRVGVYYHAGSIAPLNTPVSPRGTPFRLKILDFYFSRLLEFTSI